MSDINDFVIEDGVLIKYDGDSSDVVIPDSVTYIGVEAFRGCTGLTSIEIPNSITSIDDYAFYGCKGLTSVKIPDSVTSIGASTFVGCTGLTSIEIPSSVISIGDCAFWGCTGLTSIEIPKSVSSIGGRAFYGCTNLKEFSISQDNEFLASVDGAICSKDRKKLIQYVCLSNATHFSIPDGVTSIGDYVFFECTGLTSIEIPNSVIEIGENAFCDCNDNLVIITSAGSYAEEYAKENGIKVNLI